MVTRLSLFRQSMDPAEKLFSDVYESIYFGEFSDEEADYYNERIRHFENGDYTGTRKVDLNAIRRRSLLL